MFGWCLLCMLGIIVLSRWAWKKYTLMLSELNSRLSQVEELLLEVCSLVEEESGEVTFFPVVETEQMLAAEEGAIQTEEAPLPEINEAELPKADSEQLTRTESEEPVDTSRGTKLKNEAQLPPPPAASPPDQGSKKTKCKKGESVKQQKLPERNQQIIELYEKGLSVQEIARQIEKGQGEVQLVVDLYSQK